MNPTRILQVGCGGMSRRWLQVAASLAEIAEVVGLVDVVPAASAQRAADRGWTGRVPTFTDLGEALAATRPEVVFDCTIPDAHHPTTVAALAAGCHVLGEKPLASTLAQAKASVAAAQAAGRLYAVTQNYRYSTPVRHLRRLLASGMIGTPHSLYCDFFRGAHFGGFRDEMQHVLLLDMSIHHFDMARFFLGGAVAEAVYCHEWNPVGSWYAHGPNALATFELGGGARFSYRGSWCAEGADTPWNGVWRIVGPQGTVQWDGANQITVKVVDGTEGFSRPLREIPVTIEPTPGQVDGHASIIEEFLRCVRSGGTPETIASDNLHSLAMVFGAVASADTGTRVRVGQ